MTGRRPVFRGAAGKRKKAVKVIAYGLEKTPADAA